jgi:HK97 family phage prohead protease
MKELKFKSYASIKNYEESSDVEGKGVIKFSGWATRLTNPMTGEIEPDRDGELVDYANVALNAKVLLAQHNSDRFIGTVRMEKRENGIWFEAYAHEYLDPKVYYGLKEGILDSVSIGFMVDSWDFEELNGEEILKLLSSEIYELSVVSIPANKYATIQSNIDQVKMFKKDDKCVGLSCSIKSLKEMNPDCGCNVDELRKESKSKSEKGMVNEAKKEKGIKEMENSKTKNTETEPSAEEPTKEEPVVEETPKEETPKEELKQDTPTKEEPSVEEPKKEEPKQEPVKEEPAKAEAVPEKEPEPVNPIEDIIGKLSTFSLDSVQSEEELEAIEQAVETMRNRLDSFYDEVSEMAAQELNKDEN